MVTTDQDRQGSELVRIFGAAILVLAVWFGTVAAMTRYAEPSSAVIVFGPIESTLRVLAQTDTQLVAGGRGFLVVRSRDAGFVKALYQQGAWLVMPFNPARCGASGDLRKRSVAAAVGS